MDPFEWSGFQYTPYELRFVRAAVKMGEEWGFQNLSELLDN